MRVLLYVFTALILSPALADETVVVKSYEVTESVTGYSKTLTVRTFDAQNKERFSVFAVGTADPRLNIAPTYSIGHRPVEAREYFSSTLSESEFQKLMADIQSTQERGKNGSAKKCKAEVVFFHGAAFKSSKSDCQ